MSISFIFFLHLSEKLYFLTLYLWNVMNSQATSCNRLGTLLGDIKLPMESVAWLTWSFFILGILLELERMLKYSDLLRKICGLN